MKAIIYAAGRGTRLGHGSPKVLIELGGRSLLSRHAEHLAALGVSELVLVTGFRRAEVAAALAVVGARTGLRTRERWNPDFLEGSTLSFFASLPELGEGAAPLLIMDGDVLYPRELLHRLIQSRHPSALLVDREFSTADDDPVLAPLRRGRPFDLRKRWTGSAEAIGESVGFFKIGPDERAALRAETLRRATGSARAEPFEEVLRALVMADRLGAEDVTGLPWIEIDFPEDLKKAEKEILPLLA